MSLKWFLRYSIFCSALFVASTSLSATDQIPDDEAQQRRIQKVQNFVAVYGEPQNFDPPIDQPDFLTEVRNHIIPKCKLMAYGLLTGFAAVGVMDIAMSFVRLVQFYFSENGDERFTDRVIT